jgi:hypothetical protein
MRIPSKISNEQFNYVVGETEKILRKAVPDITVVAIPWLHVLNGHPSNQAKYAPVFTGRGFFSSAALLSYYFGTIGINLFLSCFLLIRNRYFYRSIPDDVDTLFVSHLLNLDISKPQKDFYFHDLPEYLAETRQRKCATILIDHTNTYRGSGLKQGLSSQGKFLFSKRLGLPAELSMLNKCLSVFSRFLKEYMSEKDATRKRLLWEVTLQAVSPGTFQTLRVYINIKELVGARNIKNIFCTWEGHSAERMVIYAAREAGRRIICTGYQHTILFPNSLAPKRNIGNQFNPDIILTVGKVTAGILENSGSLSNVIIIPYGSHRRSKKTNALQHSSKNLKCLVTPEGVVSECHLLFEFAVRVARICPDISFLFRTHPLVNFGDLQQDNATLRNLPNNVSVSSGKSIDDDLAASQWLLYRSSSVAIFAVLAGLRPICMEVPDEIRIDPLYMLQTWKVTVYDATTVAGIFESDQQTTENEKSIARSDANELCNDYMMEPDRSVFNLPVFGFN